MSIAAFTATVLARHRVRRRPLSAPAFVLARRPRLAATPASVRRLPAAAPVWSPRLHFVLAPRISLTFGASRRSETTVVPAPGTPQYVYEPRIAAPQIERVVEHAATLSVRHETVAAAPSVAFGHRPPVRGTAADARPPQLVLAHASAPPPAAVDPPAAPPSRQPAQPPIAWAPAAHELERLTDRVLSSIDRRFVAERERRGGF